MCLCSYLRRTEVGQHQLLFSLLTLLFNFLRHCLLLNLKASDLASPSWTASLRNPPVFIPPGLWLQVCAAYNCLFTRGIWVWIQILMLPNHNWSVQRSAHNLQEDELIRLSYCSVLEGPGFSAPEAGYRSFQMILYTLVTHAFWKLSLSPLS